MKSKMKKILVPVTPDDLLVRPSYNRDGTIDGYYALPATDFADRPIQPAAGEIHPTPQGAIEVYLADRSPEFEAEAFARGWIASRPNGYIPDKDFDNLMEVVLAKFPNLSADQAHTIAQKCESAWSRQKREG